MRTVPVTTTYLEMLAPADFRPKEMAGSNFQLMRAAIACPEFNRFLYCAVGWPWSWVDKLSWSYEQWREYVDRPQLETWVGYLEGSPAGYFELERQAGENVEIAYFGLFSALIGRGLGSHLLSAAIRRSWENGTRRVWVHTCTLDHPAALANYLARGFRVYRQETSPKELPPEPRRDWP
jgi:ribosomal protein S18 acetylase RimI-like enzyme